MICRLCLEKKPLKNSHIIPEFFYKGFYGGGHRRLEEHKTPGDGPRLAFQRSTPPPGTTATRAG